MENGGSFLTIKEFAQMVHYSERQIRQMCIDGKISAQKLDSKSRKWLIPYDEVTSFTLTERYEPPERVREALQREVDPTISKRREEHFEHLAEVAKVLLSNGLDRMDDIKIGNKYGIVHEGYELEELTQDELAGRLEGNLDVVCQRYGTWDVFNCLMAHVETEYPACQDLYGFVEKNPHEFISIIRTLTQRKNFKGTCPVCEGW